MDRGRKGGCIIGEKNLKIWKRLRGEHYYRLKKIKNREPGTGGVDHLQPNVLEVQSVAQKESSLKNTIIHNENKALLKRISIILTNKSQFSSTKEYYDMKKRVLPKSQSKRALFEKKLVDRATKQFFKDLKKLKPFYSMSRFEKEYQHQAFNQKFMRQVKYKRPKDWVDPFADPAPPETEEERKERIRQQRIKARKIDLRISAEKSTASTKSGHINRIREMRSRGTSDVHSNANVGPGSSHDNGEDSNTDDEEDLEDGEDIAENDDEEDDEEDEEFEDDDIRVDLVSMHRMVRVEEDGVGSVMSARAEINEYPSTRERVRETLTTEVSSCEALVSCYLSNNEVIVISVKTNSDGGDSSKVYEAEAEISLADLAVIRQDLVEDNSNLNSKDLLQLAKNIPLLQSLSRDIMKHVELVVESGEPRVILKLEDFEEEEQEQAQTLSSAYSGDYTEMSDEQSTLASVLQQESLMGQQSMLTNEELESLLLTDDDITVLCKGVRIPVIYLNSGDEAKHIYNEEKATPKEIKQIVYNKMENIYALVKVQTNLNEDVLTISATFVSGSVRMYKIKRNKIRAAVEAGSVSYSNTTMPSVVYADPDMVHSFAQNVTSNLKIEHDCATGENHLISQLL